MIGCIALMQESLEPFAVVQTWFIRFVVYSMEGYEDEGTFLETRTHAETCNPECSSSDIEIDVAERHLNILKRCSLLVWYKGQ